MRYNPIITFLRVGTWNLVNVCRNTFSWNASRLPPLFWVFPCFWLVFSPWTRVGKLGDVNKLSLLFEAFSSCSFFSNSFSCEEVVGNDRNKTSWTSPLFCTKKHQNPFSSLGERVVWSYKASCEIATKREIVWLYHYHQTALCWRARPESS